MKLIRRAAKWAQPSPCGASNPAFSAASFRPESEDRMVGTSSVSRHESTNRTLDIRDYHAMAANSHDLKAIRKAAGMVDQLVEVREFNDVDFKTADFRALYEYLFPNRDEAEPFDAIVGRLNSMKKLDEGDPEEASRFGTARYHVVAALNQGRVIGFTLFSSIILEDGRSLAYSQYAGLADKAFMRRTYGTKESFRSLGLLYLAYPVMQGVALEYGRRFGATDCMGVVNECEMIGQGKSVWDIIFSKMRLEIFNRNGVKVLMAKKPEGVIITPHLQPNLSDASNPVFMHLAFRPSKFEWGERQKVDSIDSAEARMLVNAVMEIFKTEAFAPPENLASVRREAVGRVDNAEKMLLVPPAFLPDIVTLARDDPQLAEQVGRDYGSLEAHERMIRSSFALMNTVRAIKQAFGF